MIPKSCAVCAVCAEEIITDGIPMGNCGQKRHVLSTCKHKAVIAVRIVSTVTVLSVEQGRPNVVGSTGQSIMRKLDNNISGAFTGTITRDNFGYTEVASLRDLAFDASLSDNRYTTNGHVYPNSLALNYIIKA